MKKNYYLCIIAIILSANLKAQTYARVSLAEWTFDWCTPSVAATTSKTTAVAPDRGVQASSALLATENITGSGRGFNWPSTTGYYVYMTNNNVLTPEKFWWVYGLNTIGCTGIQISSKQANSNTYTSGFKIQYRIGGTSGTWTDFYGPFDVLSTNTLNSPTALGDGPTPSNPAILPAACEEQSSLEIRYLLTTAQSASAGQSRIDAIIITAMMAQTTTEISNISGSVKVVGSNSKINIQGAQGSKVIIYNLMGSKLLEFSSISANEERVLPKGQIYLVRVNDKAFKVKL